MMTVHVAPAIGTTANTGPYALYHTRDGILQQLFGVPSVCKGGLFCQYRHQSRPRPKCRWAAFHT